MARLAKDRLVELSASITVESSWVARGAPPRGRTAAAQRAGRPAVWACPQQHIVARKPESYYLEAAAGVVRCRAEGFAGGGGKRGKITAFSVGSRQRLRERIRAIEWPCAYHDLAFLTWTYPGDEAPEFIPTDGRVVKRHLTAMERRFERHYGQKPEFAWKVEFQERGAIHLHLILVMPHQDALQDDECRRAVAEEFKAWQSQAWFEVVGSGSEDHRKAGTRFEFFRYEPSNCFTSYVGGEKEYQHEIPEGFKNMGRWWGTRGGLKVNWARAELTRAEHIRYRRTVRRYRRARAIHRAKLWAERKGVKPKFHKPCVPKGRKALRKRRAEKRDRRRERARLFYLDPDAWRAAEDERVARRRRLTGASVSGGGYPRDLAYQLSRVISEDFARGFTRLGCRQTRDGPMRFRSASWTRAGADWGNVHEWDWVLPGGRFDAKAWAACNGN